MSGSTDKCITTDEELVKAVNRITKLLDNQYARAHYRADIELAVWSAASTLYTKPPEVRTEKFLFVIASRNVQRELNKMRMVFPTDFQDNPEVLGISAPDDVTFGSLTFESLDEQEHLLLDWVINDGLNHKDISELTGMSQATVTRRWKALVAKLKKENIDDTD